MYTRLVMLLDTFVVKRGSICKVCIREDRVCTSMYRKWIDMSPQSKSITVGTFSNLLRLINSLPTFINIYH